jgi:hypothetical protein
MRNVYIDPFAPVVLGNKLFERNLPYNFPYDTAAFHYLKEHSDQYGVNLNTIDFWQKDKSRSDDIFISLEHKDRATKLYWRLKNKNYPIIKTADNFKKRILFHSEPPTVLPGPYKNVNRLFKNDYDKIYFGCRVKDTRCGYFHLPQQPFPEIPEELWGNSKRKFLVMINKNKKKRLYRRLTIWLNRKYLPFEKDLLAERVKLIEFFSRTNDIDLYGVDWDKAPPYPFWSYKKAIQGVYRGKVDSKYRKLSEYNFAITTENNITPGFIGEALFDCFYAGTIPIYLGAPDIKEYIPKECFIDLRDFKNYEELRLFLKSLTLAQIQQYRQAGRSFLESDKYRPFTNDYFAQVFLRACLD